VGEATQFIRPTEVPRVTYINNDGDAETVQVAVGFTVMDGAIDNGIDGIIGQCGGGCTCLTCHCYVQEPWLQRLPSPHSDELDLLEYALDRHSDSRLSCQIKITEALDGIVVRLPRTQLPE
jgi:2Fe-2S ferredoxin